jgi:hypothetical protein
MKEKIILWFCLAVSLLGFGASCLLTGMSMLAGIIMLPVAVINLMLLMPFVFAFGLNSSVSAFSLFLLPVLLKKARGGDTPGFVIGVKILRMVCVVVCVIAILISTIDAIIMYAAFREIASEIWSLFAADALIMICAILVLKLFSGLHIQKTSGIN